MGMPILFLPEQKGIPTDCTKEEFGGLFILNVPGLITELPIGWIFYFDGSIMETHLSLIRYCDS